MTNEPHYYELVFEVARRIPAGRVTTYGAIADYLCLGSARMVGWALHQCATGASDVPAHRVVNRLGELSGRHHFSPPAAMQERLEREGVAIADDRVVDFQQRFWSPMELDNE
jgi:methylated-DNA-protein-cysteine methyltransferase-like protein